MINKNIKILFVIGSALGHVGRSLMIARSLSKLNFSNIQFTGPVPANKKFHFSIDIISKEYTFTPIPVNSYNDPIFSEALEKIINKVDPELICLDLTPSWIYLVRFPKIPQIYITNWFLTSLGLEETYQDKWFMNNQGDIDLLRRKKGLTPLKNARQLYQRDIVLLCDPCDLIPKNLVENMFCVGHCSWAMDGELPDSLKVVKNCIFVSFGSTGRKKLPPYIVEKIAYLMNVENIVWLGSIDMQKTSAFSKNYQHLIYPQLPIVPILNKACFVVTHGGAGSTYQALLKGLPIGTWPSSLNHELLSNSLHRADVAINLENNLYLNAKKLKIVAAKALRFSKKNLTNGPDNAARIIMAFINEAY